MARSTFSLSLRFVLLALVVVTSGATALRGASAKTAGIHGGSYTGANFGIEVAWDADLWQAEDEGDDAGDILVLDAANVQMRFVTGDLYGSDVEQCFADLRDGMRAMDGASRFREIQRGYQLPEAPEGAVSGLFSFTLDSGGTLLQMLDYVECRPIADTAAVAISAFVYDVADVDTVFATVMPGITAVLDTVRVPGQLAAPRDTGSPSNGDPASADTNADDGSLSGAGGLWEDRFEGPDTGWTAHWDPEVWLAIDVVAADEGEGFWALTIDGTALLTIAVTDRYGDDTAACLDDLAPPDGHDASRSFSPPASPLGGEIDFSTYIFAGPDGDLPSVQYTECLALAGDRTFYLMLDADQDGYESSARPAFEQLIETIDLGTLAGDTSEGSAYDEAEKLPKIGVAKNKSRTHAAPHQTPSDAPAAAVEIVEIPDYNYRVAFDPGLWHVLDRGESGFQMQAQVSTVTFVGVDSPGISLAKCVDLAADYFAGRAEVSNWSEASDLQIPRSSGDHAGKLFTFTQTAEGETITGLRYIECRPLAGTALLTSIYFTSIDYYTAELPAWEAVIAGVEIDNAV